MGETLPLRVTSTTVCGVIMGGNNHCITHIHCSLTPHSQGRRSAGSPHRASRQAWLQPQLESLLQQPRSWLRPVVLPLQAPQQFSLGIHAATTVSHRSIVRLLRIRKVEDLLAVLTELHAKCGCNLNFGACCNILFGSFTLLPCLFRHHGGSFTVFMK